MKQFPAFLTKLTLLTLLMVTIFVSCKGGAETKRDKPEGTMVKIGKEYALYINYNNWNVETDKSKYPTMLEGIVKQYEQMGLDMLLFGLSQDNMKGSQIIVEKAALAPADYQAIMARNAAETASFIGEAALMDINGKEATLWEFEMKAFNFRYLEAIFLVGEYNVRVQFWGAKESYEEMYPEFMEIINSVVIE